MRWPILGPHHESLSSHQFEAGKVEHAEWSNLRRTDQWNDLRMLGGN